MEIEFIEAGHIYLVDGVITPSVSEILNFIFPGEYSSIPAAILAQKAEFGTHIHQAIEDFENGKEPKLTPLERVTFNDYLMLKERHNIQPIIQEEIIAYGDEFCGRLDAISMVDGEECLIDYKTTAELKCERLAWQLGMYQLAKGKTYAKCYCIWLPKNQVGELVEIKAKTKEEIIEMLERYKRWKNEGNR